VNVLAEDRPRDPVVDAAMAGGHAAFAELVDRHRAEIHRHCRRMLRSSEQAEDAVQETFLRAWRARQHFAGRSAFRTWLFRIATNACLDEIGRASRRPSPADAPSGFDTPAPADAEPPAVALARETVELAVVAAFARLPPRQRTALLLCDVLRWSAGDTAALLGTTVPSVTSALQRARARLDADRPSRDDARSDDPAVGPDDRAQAQRCVDALSRADWAAVVDLVRTDAVLGP
jgi:RNA polymerase sigma-70 factor (ECF subfamily)